MRYLLIITIIISTALSSCNRTGEHEVKEVQAVSLMGQPFYEPMRSAPAQARLDSLLLIAKKNFEADPSEENFIWYGRRTAYLLRYNESIKIFSDGIEKYPESFRLFRHRGHRYISIREFDLAVADLQQAAALMQGHPLEIEPDGQPNKLNTPLGSTQFSIWYHLGLAHYLNGNFENALMAYEECFKVSDKDDLIVATADWLYMTYRRLGMNDKAAALLEFIHEDMEIIENDSYHLRLMMYKGLRTPESLLEVDPDVDDPDLSVATQGYGLGNWYLYNGDPVKAKEIFTRVTNGVHWAAFGFIAAEAELARMQSEVVD
jgi:tetratricopeptide (TPR) repeat protein